MSVADQRVALSSNGAPLVRWCSKAPVAPLAGGAAEKRAHAMHRLDTAR
jgi:hypothetical protein